MKQLIKFKLHDGNVPYFVDKFISIRVDGNYFGISKDDVDCYLPSTVLRVNEDDIIAGITSIDLKKSSDSIINHEQTNMTFEEKHSYAISKIDYLKSL